MLRVLMVSASPETEARMRSDREFMRIIERVNGTPMRDHIRFEQIPAARFDDLSTALMRHAPHVLHISAHGAADGSLLFEDGSAGSRTVSKRRLLALLKALRDNLRLVVINACHSQQLACDIPPAIDLAVGMSDVVADRAAIAFSVAFYESLGFGKPVETAFNVALAGLDELCDEIPQLFPAPDQDPDNMRRMVLVGPCPAPALLRHPAGPTAGARFIEPRLQAALNEQRDACARAHVPLQVFHRLLALVQAAPKYIKGAFNAVHPSLAPRIVRWLRHQAERHTSLSPLGPVEAGRPEQDRTLDMARARATAEGCVEVDARHYFLVLLTDETSGTIHEIRRTLDALVSGGFAVLLRAAAELRADAASLQSDVSPLDLAEEDS